MKTNPGGALAPKEVVRSKPEELNQYELRLTVFSSTTANSRLWSSK
jgi:hypothetical protein